MNNNSNDKRFKLTEQQILAFEREKFDSKVLKKYRDEEFKKKKKTKDVKIQKVQKAKIDNKAEKKSSTTNKKQEQIVKKRKKKSSFLLLFFRFIFIFVFVFSSIYLIKWEYDNIKSSKVKSGLEQYLVKDNTADDSTQEFLVDFENLTSINSSCFAWVIVNGTEASFPVVKSTDNSYYLTHSFDKSYNPAGWIFADYKNKCDGTDKNLIIYGHNRRDGSMFASLKNILDESWYTNENNLIVNLYTPNGLEQYRVFSVYEVKAESYYLTTAFQSDETYLTFLDTLKKRSIHNFNIDLTAEDNILTLSTCSNNNAYRTVLHAKKIQASN